jgi:hypothetical protein
MVEITIIPQRIDTRFPPRRASDWEGLPGRCLTTAHHNAWARACMMRMND